MVGAAFGGIIRPPEQSWEISGIKTILTICKIHTRPLITISWKLIHYHCSEILTICLNKVWFNIDITNGSTTTLFTVKLCSIIRTVNSKT